MDYRADLHCHSTASDGTLTPEEILHLAKESGLSAISITDHDTLAAYTPENFALAEKLGVKLFTGVEFSARYHAISVHILGYNVENSGKLSAFCAEHERRRNDRNRTILEKLKERSFFISEEELLEMSTGSIVGRPHIAQVMVKKGYVKSIEQAFDRYIGERKSCFVPGESFSIQQTLDAIHEAKGKAFIAHPHLIQRNGILRVLLGMDFDGIECYYSIFHQEKKWLKLAAEKKLLVSGGSDFHGAVKPHIKLGCSWVNRETAEKIFGQ